jgi:hypothetical protein
VSVGVAYGRSFASTPRIDGEALLLTWHAGGADPTPKIERRARKEATGVVRDLKTGKTEALEGGKVPKGVSQTVPAEVRTAPVAISMFSLVDTHSL